MMYRIGVDVGGTNTDAAVLDTRLIEHQSRGVLATCKTPTTTNVTDGIKTAVEAVLVESGITREEVLNVAIGTTHFVNAVVEGDGRRLSRVAVLRLCGPYTKKNPPFSDFPYSLRHIIEGPHFYLDGGLEIDGREIAPLDPRQVETLTDKIVEFGIETVAVVGVFSALDHKGIHEERCKSIMLKRHPSLSVVCSHVIGGPGLLVRENATILNAAILSFARRTIKGFRRAMAKLELHCPLYLTQNDGTLTEASTAAEFPIKTFASGPTNSLMGAAFLQGLDQSHKQNLDDQVIVVDIGGTTTDICALLPSGFPRQAPNFVEVGGVRTAFSMPEVFSIGLGGGSRIRSNAKTGKTSVGPDSVAHRLTTDAMVFGGQILTATDIVVASGSAAIGDSRKVESISQELLSEAKLEIKKSLEHAIDIMKVSSAPVTVLLVGGGSIIVTDELDGVKQCLRPRHHDSANAVGAAIAKVAGEVDVIEILSQRQESEALEAVKQKAIKTAILRGADEQDVQIVEVKKIPLQYVTNKATRFAVKAVGSLNVKSCQLQNQQDIENDALEEIDKINAEISKAEVLNEESGSMTKPTLGIDLAKYRPRVENGVWYLSPVDVEFIAIGTGILGTGGGGSSYNMALYVLDILRREGQDKMRVISPEALKDSDICVFGAGYGAPSVSDERIPSGTEPFAAVEALNKVLGYSDFQAIVADEIGGGNGLVTFPTSARYDRPVVDGDLMGRAYPTMEHGTPYVYGAPITPCATSDGKGNVAVIMSAESNKRVEGMLRTACIELGNSTAVAAKPLTGDIIKRYVVPNTVSQAWFLGRAVQLARQTKVDFIDAISGITPVKLLYTGKIIDVSRDVSRGYTMGQCVIGPISADEEDSSSTSTSRETRNLVIPFQNEYLAASLVEHSSTDAAQEMICTVPDLISILGQDGEALGSPELRYGLKVKVIGMPAHPLWTGTEAGMKVGGPEFFGLQTPWKSVGEYRTPKSVISEFS